MPAVVARLLHVCGTIFGATSSLYAPFGHLTADWSAGTCPPVELPLLAASRLITDRRRAILRRLAVKLS